jgi:hypothetical protein
MRILWCLVLCLLSVAPASAGTTRYASPNGNSSSNCTQNDPCTLGRSTVVMQGGDTLILAGGDYPDWFGHPYNMVPSGNSDTDRTTVIAAQGQVPILHGLGFPGGVPCCNPTHQFITFNGIHLVNAGLSFGRTRYISFMNGRIANAVIDASGGGGMGVSGAGNHHYFGYNEVVGAHYYGFYVSIQDSIIENNDIHDNQGYGLHFFCAISTGGPDIGTFACRGPGDTPDEPHNDRNIVRNNRFWNNGICIDPTKTCYSSGHGNMLIGSGSDYQVYNNLLWDSYDGIVLYPGCKNCKVYNNTVWRNQNRGIVFSKASEPQGPLNPVAQNNIMFANGGLAFDNEGNASISPVSTPNFTTDPSFASTNPNDRANFLTLQPGSTAKNTGTTALYANTDFSGNKRYMGSGPDFGAREFVEGVTPPPTCPAACPTTCINPTTCPPTSTPTAAPIYLSAGGHADSPTDSGDCLTPENIATPRATLAGALACMTVPGKVLYIRGGTYAGKIDTGGNAVAGGTTPADPTRIEGYQSEAVTITLSGGSVGLFVRDISNLTVSKLTVDALNTANTNAMACINGTNIKLVSNAFRNSYYESGYFANCSQVEIKGTPTTPIVFSGAQVTPVVSFDGTSNNVMLEYALVTGGAFQGVAVSIGSGSNSSLSLLRSQIRGNAGLAVDLGPGTGAAVVNNILDHNGGGIVVRSGATGSKVYHNAVAMNTGPSIQCDAGASNVFIANNIAFGNATDLITNNCSATVATNLTSNPLWVNATTVPYDFHLQLTPVPSPALDVLSSVLPEATIAIDGTTRPVGPLADLGPYEQAKITPPAAPTTALSLIARYLGMFF